MIEDYDDIPGGVLGQSSKREKLTSIARGREPKFPDDNEHWIAWCLVRLMELNPNLRPWLSLDAILAMEESEQQALLDSWRKGLVESYAYQDSLSDEELEAYWTKQAKELDDIVSDWA